jgi:hypothetical protein
MIPSLDGIAAYKIPHPEKRKNILRYETKGHLDRVVLPEKRARVSSIYPLG